MDNQNLPNQTPPVVPPTPVEPPTQPTPVVVAPPIPPAPISAIPPVQPPMAPVQPVVPQTMGMQPSVTVEPPMTPVAPTFTPPQPEQSTAPTLTPTPEPAVSISTTTTTTAVEPQTNPSPAPSLTTSATSSAPKPKMSRQTLLIIMFLIGLVLIGGIGYAIGRNTPPAPSPAGDTSLTQLEGGPADFNDTPEMVMGGQTDGAPSASPMAAATKYTSGTFSFNYPEGWIVIDGKDNPSYFSEKGLTGFDQLIMLEREGYYLFIGSDNSVDAEVGGIFTSDAEYQEYLQRRTPVMIGQDQFYLNKSDSKLSILTSPDREAGIFGLASLSEYQQNKVTNNQQQTFNGFSDYIGKNGKGYVFVKLSDGGNEITPEPIQTELVNILSTIQW